jgi:uncharacterized protein (TIGR00369 family)
MLATFADTAMAVALWDSHEPEVAVSVTTDMHLRYYRQPRSGPLSAEATDVHKGRRLLGTEFVVSDAEERVLARSTATCMVAADRCNHRAPRLLKRISQTTCEFR